MLSAFIRGASINFLPEIAKLDSLAKSSALQAQNFVMYQKVAEFTRKMHQAETAHNVNVFLFWKFLLSVFFRMLLQHKQPLLAKNMKSKH